MLTNYICKRGKWLPVTDMFIWSKLGENLLEMEVRRFARIKKVIWDQLLDTKAGIIQSKLYFRFASIMPELNLERLTRGHNKGF